jgi:ATP-dependent protease ClpP protease subunit
MKFIVNIDPRFRFDISKARELADIPYYVRFTGPITEKTAEDFRRDLMNAENFATRSKQDIIPVIIDSFGGDIYALSSMIDAINHCSLPISTIVEGKAMGAAAILFSFGKEGYRYMGENARLMIHKISYSNGSSKIKMGDYETTTTDNVDVLNKHVFGLMSKNCGKEEDYFYSQIKAKNNADWHLNATECAEHNIANHIKLPLMKIDMAINVSFG